MLTVKLHEVVTYRKQFIEISDQETYKRCRVQLHRRGVKLRDMTSGSDIKTKKQRLCKANDFIVAEMDAKFGGYGIIPKELHGAIVSSHYYLYELDQSRLLPEFLTVIIDSGVFDEQIKAVGSTNYSRVSAKEVLEYEIPCPPLDEQRSIIDFYFRSKETCFDLGSELTHQQTLLKKLRQQILQEAIEGKLTEDFRVKNKEQLRIWNDELRTASDPETIRHLKLKIRNCSESAASLLSRIKAEKEALIKAKKIKKQNPLPPITDKEKPFDLPEGWVWCRLGYIGHSQTGTTPPTHDNNNYGNFIPFVQPADINLAGQINCRGKQLSEKGLHNGRLIHKDSILMVCIGGSIGKSAVNHRDVSCNQQINAISPLGKMNSFFIQQVFQSPYFQGSVWDRASGGTTPIVNKSKWESIPIPIPPLPEQQAIVAKVEKLLTICDQLEAQISQNQTHAEALMQAVLKEAFQEGSQKPERMEVNG